jgi:hypothetical protein
VFRGWRLRDSYIDSGIGHGTPVEVTLSINVTVHIHKLSLIIQFSLSFILTDQIVFVAEKLLSWSKQEKSHSNSLSSVIELAISHSGIVEGLPDFT